MAKCPKCQARKGKRHCPALETMICSQCCAEHRLQTIPCPKDCVHLEGEHYQLARRRHKARSLGRQFVEKLVDLFWNEKSREFAFLLQADVYWWMAHNGKVTNEQCAVVYEDLKNRLSSVYVPSAAPRQLAKFLYDLLEKSPRHKEHGGREFTDKHRRDVLEVLARHVRSLGDPQGATYYEEIDGYFAQLDFEADLDYSPAEELEKSGDSMPGKRVTPTGFRQGSSGLIVPGS